MEKRRYSSEEYIIETASFESFVEYAKGSNIPASFGRYSLWVLGQTEQADPNTMGKLSEDFFGFRFNYSEVFYAIYYSHAVGTARDLSLERTSVAADIAISAYEQLKEHETRRSFDNSVRAGIRERVEEAFESPQLIEKYSPGLS